MEEHQASQYPNLLYCYVERQVFGGASDGGVRLLGKCCRLMRSIDSE
jgi:hypothetical protein